MIHPERVRSLRPGDAVPGRRYVLYWMQQSQRAHANHALEYAIDAGNALQLPVLAVFGLAPTYPQASASHYDFMIEGLRQTAADLQARGVGFALRRGNPPDLVLQLAQDAALLVTDRGYLRLQRQWRERVASAAPAPLVEVESDVVVPVETAASKEAYTAATFRPGIHRQMERFLVPLRERVVTCPWSPGLLAGGAADAFGQTADQGLRTCGPPPVLVPAGYRAAVSRLQAFVRHHLGHYHLERSDPANDTGSGLSPYLHFGQIAALEVALAVRATDVPQAAAEAFLEELIVRRELAVNFVHYNPGYDTYAALPAWSRRTLEKHAADPRPYLYRPADLEAAATHDPFWNAAQTELLRTGRMQGYMRMYWGKKIIEWSRSPEDAFTIALDLNDRYELDGRDPNGYAGVIWCFGKHDRPWVERPVFGQVRYMNDRGLCRKFDMNAYVARVGC